MTNDPSMTKVRRWMTPSPLTIEDSASIVEAIHKLKEKNIRRLPVMHGGKLVGVVTEKMLKDFTPSKATSLDTWEVHYLLARTPVTAAMNPKPHKVRPDDEIADVAKLMEDRKLNGVAGGRREGRPGGDPHHHELPRGPHRLRQRLREVTP